MAEPLEDLFGAQVLLQPPTLRAAYSDRTAWLMSAMSELAYYRFEGEETLESLAKALISLSNARDVENLLKKFLERSRRAPDDAKKYLKDLLALANFDLINIYDRAGTQAFLAKRNSTGSGSMLVLAFRGTEKELADIKADLRADLVPTVGDEKVHRGFRDAFDAVKADIEKDLRENAGAPIYITGHSLGGALAVLATRFLASDSQGACYTFGGPRVGNEYTADNIKTPIYRVVNAADIVPRLPPAFLPTVLITIIKWIPLPLGGLASVLHKLRGYVHFGDMRYLTHVEAGADEKFAKLRLLSNPSLPFRLVWVVRRWIATGGKAAVGDHSISLYRKKLMAYAIRRN